MKTSVHDDPRHAVHYELKLNTPSDTRFEQYECPSTLSDDCRQRSLVTTQR
jgi:hypothetical protein